MYPQQLMPEITFQQQQDRHAYAARQRQVAAAEASGPAGPEPLALVFDLFRDFYASWTHASSRTALGPR
jgi:hypothetical protein